MAKRKFYRSGKNLSTRLKNYFKKAVKAGFVAGIFFLFLVLSLFAYYAQGLSDPETALKKKIAVTTKIYDRSGEVLLSELHGDKQRTIISKDQIPDTIKEATIAVEDEEFYDHIGIDPSAILRAIWTDIKKREIVQGGSTITQQFVKNSILTPERTLKRKIKEVIYALEIERKYSKEQILTWYLNQIPYGRLSYGIGAASQAYFDKPAKKLSTSEAATLAALPKAPTYYGSHPKALKRRQEFIINKMNRLGYITEKERRQAIKKGIEFSEDERTMKAPHFARYVKSYLERKVGTKKLRRRKREKGGLKIITSLDWELQKKAQKIIKKKAQRNEKIYNASNASLVAIDPETGEILSMVGSRNFHSDKIDGQVNVSLQSRQPGSAFKPFVYATALEKGLAPQTKLFDVRTEFNASCPWDAYQQNIDQVSGSPCYHPNNYGGITHGPVSIREALAQSLNIPAVKALHVAGIGNTINKAEKAGITTFQDRNFGLSLVLGGAGVKLLELTNAYSVFPEDGNYTPIQPIIGIKGLEQETKKEILPDQPEKKEVFSQKTARAITNILSDNKARAPMFGTNNNLNLKTIPTAAKTGTTQNNRDAWTVGFNPNLVVGIWAGNNDNEQMNPQAIGSTVAAPIWNEFMRIALEEKPKPEFKPQSSFNPKKPMLNGNFGAEKTVEIDQITGKKATKYTPETLIKEKKYKTAHNILYYINKENPRGAIPQKPDSDPQFENWEKSVQNWVASQGRNSIFKKEPPEEYDDIHLPGNKPEVTINTPKKEETITGNKLKLDLEAEAKLGLKQIDIFLDQNYLGSINSPPWKKSFPFPETQDFCEGKKILRINAYDRVQNSAAVKRELDLDRKCEIESSKEPSTPLKIKENKNYYQLWGEIININNPDRFSFYYYQTSKSTKLNQIKTKKINTTSSDLVASSSLAKDELEDKNYAAFFQVKTKSGTIYKSDEVTFSP